MRRLAFLIIMLVGLLSLAIPQFMAQQDPPPPTDTDSILQWVDSEPLTGQDLGLEMPITIYFDRPIDCATLDSAFSITPTIAGTLTCGSSSFTFAPSTAFDRASTYTVILDTDLRGVDSAQLFEDLTINFNTIGFLQITETFPSDDSYNLELDTSLTVIFNHPIVPLTLFDAEEELINPLVIDPPIEGTGEWINTSIFAFYPDNLLPPATDYTVTIPSGIIAQDGAVLPDDYQFDFSTQPITITEFFPRGGDYNEYPLDQTVQVRFNTVMNQSDVEDSFTMLPVVYEAGTITILEEGDPIAGTFEWAEDSQGFRFIPDENLELDTYYQVRVQPEGVLTGDVYANMIGEGIFDFRTVPLPSITNTRPDNNEETSPYGGFVIYFDSPMDEETNFEDFITIDPLPEFEPRYYWRQWSNSLEVSFQPYASAEYTITVDAGLADDYGNTIDEPYSFSYTTRPFEPLVNLRIPDNVGFYNAERDPTSLFVTYRNVESFDVNLYSIPTDDFTEALVNSRYVNGAVLADDLISSQQIDATGVPVNAMRYDLLQFDETIESTICDRNLPTRLYGLSQASVAPSPDPVSALTEPVIGDVVDLLYPDYLFDILDLPICGADGQLWWNLSLRDGTSVWIPESTQDTYLLAPVAGTSGMNLAVGNDDGTGLDAGIYYLNITNTEGYGRNQDHVMVVANANIVIKHTIDSIMIWATDVQTGQPIPDAPIKIYGDNGDRISEPLNVVAEGFTDADGILYVELDDADENYERRVVILESDVHFGVGYSDWTDGIRSYQFGQSSDYTPDAYSVYLYSDRPVYRPGQPVYLRGTVLSNDDMVFSVPDAETIYMTVENGFGETIYSGDVDIDENGVFTLTLDLADDTRLGYYSALAYIQDGDDFNRYAPTGRVRFNVAEYRLPEFLVDVTPNQEEVVQGDNVSVTVDATYFFGGSVSNAMVEYNVIGENYFFRYEGNGYYNFYDYNYDSGPSEFYASNSNGVIASGIATTDAQGDATIEFPAILSDASQSQSYLVEVTVTDETGQAVSGRGSVIVHQGEIYIGGRAENYVSRVDEEATINLISVDWDSNAVANQTIDVEVVRREWSSVQERDENGYTVWRWEVEEIPITDSQITTDGNGQAQFNFTPEEGGSYKVILTSRDSLGNEIRSSTYVWVSSYRYVSWRQQNSNRIDLITDADEYNVGDTAQILIASPFQGEAQAFITVERADIITYDVVTMDTNSYLYELPIEANFAPNVYVSVVIVKGVDETNPVAAFRMGYVELVVDPEQQVLNIDITSDVDRTSPQQTVTYTVTTTDWQGNPVPATLGVGVTDLAALSLAPDNSTPIFNHFFRELNLGVVTSTPLTINTDQITQEVLDTVKGGGGGVVADGLIEIRGEFIDTPFFDPFITTDATGTATFDVRLPDNLTTWRLDARGHALSASGELLVGQNTYDILSTRPVIIRPVTPRFFVVGDEVVLASVVNNNTQQEQTVVVTMNYEGVTILEGEQSQVITIPADSRARVTWRVTVDDAEFSRFSFIADAGNYTDGAISGVSIDDEGTIPIYRYAPPEVGDTVGTAGVLTTSDSRVETIYLPERFNITEGTLTVQVEQSLAATTIDGLNYLASSSHESTNATVSRFLPNIMTFRALETVGLADDVLENNLNRNVNLAVQKLVAEQHSDGGWGWYVNGRSNTSVTAYALIGLVEAQAQGYTVPDETISRAIRYLNSNLIAIQNQMPTWELNRQTFVLYALARAGEPDVARSEVVYRNRARMSLYSQALLAQTFYYIDPIDTSRTDVLLAEIMNESITSAAGVHWEENYYDYWNWNTDTRTTAIILDTMVLLRPQSDLLPNVVRYLMIQRQQDSWETSQETAWAVIALTSWMQSSGELNPNYAYDISLNGDTRLSGNATASTARDSYLLFIDVAELAQGQANTLVFTRTGTNEGNLYYTAYLTAYLEIPNLEPVSNGMTVTRTYTLQNDPEGTPITQATVGDIIEVRLTVVVPDSRHYVEVYDPLPAGAEGINPDLQTNQQVGTRPSLSRNNPLRYGWGWWWFSDIEFRDEAVVLTAEYLPSGTYEFVYAMRAGIEGTYNVIPPSTRQVYFPDIYGRGAGSEFVINPPQQ